MITAAQALEELRLLRDVENDARVRGETALLEAGIDFEAERLNGRVVYTLRNAYDVGRADDMLYGDLGLRGYELRVVRRG